MKNEVERICHPDPGPANHVGKTAIVYGHRLEAGDVLEAADLYSSTNGYFEPCPCPGLTLEFVSSVVWVRPRG